MDKTDNIFDRIEYVIEKEGLNISSFAKEIGVGDQTVRTIVKRRESKPGFDVLSKIIQKYSWLNARWFITGEGFPSNKDAPKSLDSNEFYMNIFLSQQKIIENLSVAIRDKCAGNNKNNKVV